MRGNSAWLVSLCILAALSATYAVRSPHSKQRKIVTEFDDEDDYARANWLDKDDRRCQSYRECCAGATCKKSVIPSVEKPAPKKCILDDQRECVLCPFGFSYVNGICSPDVRRCPEQAAQNIFDAISKDIPDELRKDPTFMVDTMKNPCRRGELCIHTPHLCITSAVVDRGCPQFQCVVPEAAARTKWGEGDVCKSTERFDPVPARCVPIEPFSIDMRPCRDCVFCNQGTPTCDRPCKVGEECIVLPQSCSRCASAVCANPADLVRNKKGHLWPKGFNADADEFDVDGAVESLTFPYKSKKSKEHGIANKVTDLLESPLENEDIHAFFKRIDKKRPYPKQKCVSCSTLPSPSCDQITCPSGKECEIVSRSCKHCQAIRCVPKQGHKAPDCD